MNELGTLQMVRKEANVAKGWIDFPVDCVPALNQVSPSFFIVKEIDVFDILLVLVAMHLCHTSQRS